MMKNLLLTFTTILISLALSAQQPSTKPVTNQPTAVKLLTAVDSVQYSLGAFIGQWLSKNSFTVSNQALFQRGMNDVLQNKKLAVADTVVAPLVASYQLSLQNARSKALEQQLFAALNGKPGVGALPDGVHYIVVRSGTGIRPLPRDTVVINAIGVFADGTVFEDTFQKKQTINIMTSNLIPGLSEAIQLMQEGSVWRIFVPSALAYGPTGRPGVIPPNSALVFDITLMQVKSTK